MNVLLKSRHWALFLLAVGIPIISAFAQPIIAIAEKDLFLATSMAMSVTMLGALLSMLVIVGWFYAIGSGLQLYLPDTARSNISRLKLFALVPVIYVAALTIYLVSFSFKRSYPATTPSVIFPVAILLIVLMHLFSMFCIFYCMYTAARTLKSVELKRKTTFGDFAGEFFLMWFFPIGIWIIQPRINKIVAQQPEADMDIFTGVTG